MAEVARRESIDETMVVVIGGGPSGSQAARLLAEAGIDAVILDGKMEIGSPVICADAVNLSATGLGELESDRRISLLPVGRVTVSGPEGSSEFSMNASGGNGDAFNSIVERDRLDKELSSRALLSGARLWIRSMVTGISENEAGVEVTFRKDGKLQRIISRYAIYAGGSEAPFPLSPGSQQGGHFIFRYRRSVGASEVNPRWSFPGDGRIQALYGRGEGQYNDLEILPGNPGESRTVQNEKMQGRSIVSGERTATFPEPPFLGQGRILYAGASTGIYDPFFMTGFRESVMTGELAARAVLSVAESGADPLPLYRKQVEQELLKDMERSLHLSEKMRNASSENLAKFVSYLSGFEYSEISCREIYGVTALKENEIDGFLSPEV